ncbi:AAA family ATPase [Streptomyces sp. NPDC055794]
MDVQVNGPVVAARRLVVVSVADYGDQDSAFAEGVGAQVSVVADWLTAPQIPERDRFEVSRPKTLERVEDLRRFLLEQDLASAAHDEALVVYITGHGVKSAAGHHYLTFSRTDPQRLLATAFPNRELIAAVLDSEAEHVMILVDSCFAGALGAEVAAVVNDLTAARRALPTIAVITSGDVHEQPYVGEFTRLIALSLAKAADEAAGYVNAHLSLAEWEQLLAQVSAEHPELIEPVWVWPRSRKPVASACLPNPAFRAVKPVVAAARQEVSLDPEILQYWVSRASGRVSEEDTGWYFSGRSVLMRELIGFLDGGSGVLVVTGAAGSGKSGLLARLVTLSDPVFLNTPGFALAVEQVPQDLRPPVGAVNAAVLARAKTSLMLLEDLLEALGHPQPPGGPPLLQALMDVLAGQSAALQRAVTVVIDGVDEAQRPLECLSDVVVPLSRLRTADGKPAVRLLLGLRSSAPQQSGSPLGLRDERADQLLSTLVEALEGSEGQQPVASRLVRTDLPDSAEDIAAYAAAVLAQGPAYRDAPTAVPETARLIAQAVWPSFLDARLAAAQLHAARALQDLNDPAWLARLASGTAALLRDDLEQVARDHQIPAYALLAALRAAAFGQGAGLPWAEVWPAAVRGLLDGHVSPEVDVDAVIRLVHGSRLSGYLAHDVEDGRVAYRPVHQRVAEALLNEPASLLAGSPDDPREHAGLGNVRRSHRGITRAFARLVQDAAPLSAHPYLRRYLLAHADAGAVMDDEHVMPALLVQETSRTLRARLRLPLPVDDTSRPTLVAAALVEPYLDDSVDGPSRLSSIAFQRAALSHRHDDESMLPLAEPAFAPLTPAWTATWSQWQANTNVLASPRGAVRALCAFVTPDGRALVAAATRVGVGVWDGATGQQLSHIRVSRLRDLVTLKGRDGRTFLVSAGKDGAALWDPLSGRCLTVQPRTAFAGPVRAVRVLRDEEEEWLLALVAGDRIHLWRPGENHLHEVALPHPVAPRRARDFVVVRGKGRPPLVAFTGHSNRRYVAVCDPVEASVAALEMPFGFSGRSLVSVRGPAGHDVLVTQHGFRHGIYVWDPYTHAKVSGISGVASGLYSLPGADGHQVLGIQRSDTLSIHDLGAQPGSAAPSTVPYTSEAGHGVTGLAASPTRPWTIVTAGQEGIRLTIPGRTTWEQARALQRRRVRRPTGRITSLCAVGNGALAGVRDRKAVLLSADDPPGVGELPMPSVRSVTAFPDHPDVIGVQAGDELIGWNLRAACTEGAVSQLADGSVWCATALPDGFEPGWVIAAPSGLSLHRLDGEALWQVPLRPDETPETLSVWRMGPHSPDVIVGGCGDRIIFWTLACGDVIHTERAAGRSAPSSMVCLPSSRRGKQMLAVATGSTISLWKDLAVHTTLETHAAVNALTVVKSPGKPPLLAAGTGTGVQLWNPHTFEAVHTLLTAAPVSDLASVHHHRSQQLWISGRAGTAVVVETI